jgi:outer membrane receptor protein involved in Fe transport
MFSHGLSPFPFSIVIAVLAVCLAMSAVAPAQSTATLQGVVTDPTNAAVANATILIRSTTTGVERTTATDAAGAYLFTALLPDVYHIEISAHGFQKFIINDLKLDVATTVTENARMTLGSISQQIEVAGGAPLVDTTTISVGQVIDDKTVQDIPLNGRHFVDLVNLVPGTVTAPQNGFLADPLAGLGQLGVDTAGQRENTTNWLVNGINLNDELQNQVTFQPSIDTIAEFKVDNSTFAAEYGRNSGAIVNIATRSGTNSYHGSAFEYIRNDFFDARNYFNPVSTPQSKFNRNNFGADFGGPIKRNKAFFFLSYEGLRQKQGITLETPLPAPGSTSASPAVTNLLKLLPSPNGTIPVSGGGTEPAFLGSAVLPVNLDIGTADLSFNFTPHDQLHGYYAIEVDHRFEPQAGGIDTFPGWGDTRDARRQLLTIDESHQFATTLTNDVRLGFNRVHITFLPNGVFDPATEGLGLPPGVPAGIGLPLINVLGNFTIGSPQGDPEGRGDTTGVLADTVSWLRGRHSIKFGGEIRRFYNNNLFDNLGNFTYGSITDFLNDSALSYSTLAGNGDDKILEAAWGLFVQDSYKLRPNVTLSLGLRYDWNSTPTEASNRFSLFDPATDALVQVGTPGFGQIYQTNNKNFQPRVGLAWDPWGDGKTSVRAGYAIMTQQPVTNIASGLTENPPFATPFAASGGITLEAPPASPRTVAPTTIQPNLKNAYSQDWNFTIQRSLTNTMGLQVAYVGSKGTHLQQVLNENQPAVVNGIYGSAGPFPNFSEITEYASEGISNYNALWITFNKQVSHGLQFLASYTYSKSLDEASLDVPNPPFTFAQDSNNARADYGPSDYDARHRFVVSGFYQLPFQGNPAIAGWEIAFISSAQSGNPLQPNVPSGIFPGVSLRPDVIGSLGVTNKPVQWFSDPGAFISPCIATTCAPGDMGRNSVIGPKFVDSDLSLVKDTKITERVNLQFRADAFDVFNHPNFGNPNVSVGSSSFGVITSTRFANGDFGSARQLQLALKLQF